jgi:transposase
LIVLSACRCRYVARSPVDGSATKQNLNTGDLVDTIAVTRRFDLTDAEWVRLEPLLPKRRKSGRPSKWSKRQLIDGVRWRVRVGAPWRDVPDCYGSWQAVYALFRRWQRARIWQQHRVVRVPLDVMPRRRDEHVEHRGTEDSPT